MSKILLVVGKFLLSVIVELVLVAIFERAVEYYLDSRDAKNGTNTIPDDHDWWYHE